MDLSNVQIKNLLNLGNSLCKPTIDKFDTEAIKVLKNNGLVEVLESNVIKLTDKGRELIEEL